MHPPSWDDIKLSDDFLFGAVMRNSDLCKELIEKLLGISIDHIEYMEGQKTINLRRESKGIRIDVYVKDNKGTVYDVEIQTSRKTELPKRSRYYQSTMDLDLLKKGKQVSYKQLNRSYIIFICTEDVFGQGRYQYTFRNLCIEDPNLELNDETAKVFFNTKGTVGEISPAVRAFLKYVDGQPSDDKFIQRLESEVERIRNDEDWRRDYMTLFEKIQEAQEDARKEGREEGREERQKELIRNLLRVGTDIKQLIQATGLSEEKIRELGSTIKSDPVPI